MHACGHPLCPSVIPMGDRLCIVHLGMLPIDLRPSSGQRGYDSRWRRIRAQVLTAHGIPSRDWHLYDIDHDPPYDAEREPDHLKYKLTPRLHGEHSSKTAREDGGFGNPER